MNVIDYLLAISSDEDQHDLLYLSYLQWVY